MINKELAAVQSDILNAYYADNARKLHKVVDKILFKFGGLSSKDTDDFYSLAIYIVIIYCQCLLFFLKYV